MNLKVSDAKREEGFTLIELLVVVIIIGILAAIAIPVFLNQRERAWIRTAESDARNAAIEVETYFNDNFAYPLAVDGALVFDGISDGLVEDDAFGAGQSIVVSPNVLLEYTKVSDQEYSIRACHDLVHTATCTDGDTITALYNNTQAGLTGDYPSNN